LALLLFIFTSCETPRHLTKKGDKLSEKELYYDACSQYFKALNKKSNFLKATEGLRFAGNKQIDSYLDDFFKNKSFGDKRKAIYLYRDAFSLKQKIEKYSINIEIPQMYSNDYNQLLDDYVESSYNHAVELLGYENFSESELLFKEISILKPNFKDVDNMKDIATFEPIYRKANGFLEMEKFRSSYYEFDKVPLTYKDCNEQKSLALSAGLITISILDFENTSNTEGVESAIASEIKEELMKLNNPFIKLVDRKLTNKIIDEQVLGMSGQVTEGTNAKAGEIIGAKALLSGKLVTLNIIDKPIKKNAKKGWVEKLVIKYKEDKTKYTDTIYKKVVYNICKGSSSAKVGFNFQLTSTESGEILQTKFYNLSKEDNVHYADSPMNHTNIIPGYWARLNKNSSEDFISDSKKEKKSLDLLFKNKKNLMLADQLSEILFKNIAVQISQQINNYNPENE
jgi:hypothetical protein